MQLKIYQTHGKGIPPLGSSFLRSLTLRIYLLGLIFLSFGFNLLAQDRALLLKSKAPNNLFNSVTKESTVGTLSKNDQFKVASATCTFTPSNITVSFPPGVGGTWGFSGPSYAAVTYTPDGSLNGAPKWSVVSLEQTYVLRWSGSPNNRWEIVHIDAGNFVAAYNLNGDISNIPCASTNWIVDGEYGSAIVLGGGCGSLTATTVTPSVSILGSPSGAITIGTSVTFTATPTNGGTTPAYQWKKNGGNVGSNSNTYTDATLLNGDKITCVMTSNNACASPTTATSNEITMSVTEPAALCITAECTGFAGTYTKGAAYNGRLTFSDGKGHTIFYANPNWVLVNGTAGPMSTIVFEAPSTAVLPPASGWGASEDTDCFETTLTLVQGSCLTCETPTAFTVGGGGTYCTSGTGVSITLSGSQDGTSYQLIRNGSPVGTPKTGTGAALTFGPEKFAAGTYTIEASVSGGSPTSINNSAARVATDACTAPMNGSVTVTPVDPPTADGGINKTTCGRTAVALAAVTVSSSLPDNNTPNTGTTSVSGGWSGGAGTFSNAASPTSTYTPAQSEVGTTVTLTWTVLATSPCATNATDQMTVTVSTPPTAEAGANKTTCGQTAVALAATGTGTWSGGAGMFSNANSATSTYTPAASEVGTTVTLTWTVAGTAPCINATDQMTVTVGTPVTADAGANKTTCGQTAIALAASTGVVIDFIPDASTARMGATTGTWSGGAGMFSNASSPTSTYTPAASEVGTTVTLTWTVAGTAPCTNATDQMTVTVTRPTTTASLSVLGNATGCAGSTNTPKVVFTGAGGTAPYTFTYTINGGAPQTITTTSGNSVQLAHPTSTAGTFVYSLVSVVDNIGCRQAQNGTVSITIEAPAAGGLIIYNNNPFCANAGTANITRTAPAGGTYSCDTPGLSLNATTGAVNLASSTPGTYLVKYTIVGPCTNMTTTASITITAAPTATIAYANSPYCAGSGTANVTLTGKTGGVFSSTTGLNINANTGQINLAASTAGSYVVTYTIAATNGCGELKTTANVSITTAPTATIAYANSPYCSNAGTASVTLTGSQGGTFSSTAGLSINANTGAIDLAASTAGSYVVTYTIAAANSCPEFKTTANVTITAAPTATIAYSNSPYCKGSGTATVTLTGRTGGVFSSTSGLSIDANTGAINLATSTAGTYVVTYTLAAANGCGELTTTANVSITTTPSATIAYANTPYCSNAGTASVTLTGSQGGTFSSTAGLSINVATGEINLATSTTGTYVVTYTIAAANGCPEFKTTASITITTAPTATIVYSNSPYCAGAGTATVTLTGTTGGVFSSTLGLSINANTGAIDLAASTAGSYVVTYTITAANGCGELTTTANVTITTTPSATIAYANTPYCANAGTASVTLTGSQGGTFSSIAGLSINVATGAINLANSTAGTYVVTYTIAAANGCPEFKTTANVSITAAPTATIAYSNSPYCANAGTASVTLTGTTGGVFSSTSGLNIDANTGAINLATSNAGSYVVTYTIAAANGCGELKTTANVSITTTPSATIAYANTPYCSNGGTASVTLTGSQGGTFSSTAGLSINVATGEINLATSTAGSYVVTYTIAAANGCAEFKTTANVSITAASTATIAYSNSTYCATGTASVTLTGATGGVFSSSTGLSINANTGAIDLAASTAGTYVVTYIIAAANGCGELKATTNVTVQSVLAAPVISSNQSSSVCMGTEVLLYTNCPQGSTVLWSNNSTATILALNATSPSEQTITVKCQGAGVCESPASEAYTVKWSSTFSLTLINVGKSQSAIKENNAPKSSWSSQFITPDAGPTIETSTEANPTIYYSENMNKTAPRYWTIHAETCNLGTAGSLTFDMLAKDEQGVERSYNTHENSAPYLMYANRSGFTELYAQNHPLYGFYQDNGSGGNVYDAGLPKGFYKLAVRYWDLKGWGSIYPATRKPQGNVLAYQEFWFRIQSKDGVGAGAARIASDKGQRITENGLFAEVMPNPVASVLRLKVADSKAQKVSVSLLDASGRTLLQLGFVPETNQHQEEFNVSEMANGMYFLKVNAGDKQTTLKVVKVQ